MQEIIDSYQRYLATITPSAHTIQGYTADLGFFARWWEQGRGEDFDPANITPRDLLDYKAFLLTVKGFKTATVNRRLSAVSRFLKWARAQGLTEVIPPDKLQVKVKQEWAPRALDRNEQNALLREASRRGHPRDLAVIQLLLGTGLRSSEVAALRCDDLELSERKGWVRVRAGKGGAPREVPLNRDARKALCEYLAARGEIQTDHLFAGQRGAITTKGVSYLVRKYAYLARLEDCTVHTLRHTFAKNLLDAGVSIDRVGLLLGHESLDTTRIYTKPTKTDLEQDVEKIAVG
jgi:site-specific recombinase XerD